MRNKAVIILQGRRWNA